MASWVTYATAVYNAVISFITRSGRTYWVHATLGSDNNTGLSKTTPLATLDAAIGKCTASKGDRIILMEGHAETFSTSATHVTIDIAGIEIVGMGEGASRPTFTFSHTGATWVWSAGGCTLRNVLLVTGIDSVVVMITISGADWKLDKVEVRDTTDVEVIDAIITTAAAERGAVIDCFHNGYTGGNACARFLKLVGVDGLVVRGCRFFGLYSTAAINFLTTACTKVEIDDCKFLNGTTAVTGNVVDTVGGSSWVAKNCYDMIAGYQIAGGSGQALGYSGGKLLYATKTTTSPLPNNTNIDLFNYIGLIRIHEVIARISTVIGAGATAVKFQLHPSTDTAETDICAALDIDADAADSIYRITGDFSDALLGATDVAAVEGDIYAGPIVTYGAAATSALKLHSAAATTGALQVTVVWEPVSPGARLYAA